MRILLVAALLLLPLAAADPAPLVRNCGTNHCAIAQDVDGDGDYDWVSVATVVGEQVTANVNYDAGTLHWHVDTTTEEVAEEAGFTVQLAGESNETSRSHEAGVWIAHGKHETGVQEEVARVDILVVLP